MHVRERGEILGKSESKGDGNGSRRGNMIGGNGLREKWSEAENGSPMGNLDKILYNKNVIWKTSGLAGT